MDTKVDTQGGLTPALAAKAGEIQAWLIGEARFIDDPDLIVDGFCRRVLEAGVPLDRMMGAIFTLHASRAGLGRRWTPEEGVQITEFSWESRHLYERSPFFKAHETRKHIDFRLDEIDDEAFGIVPELRADGITHYLTTPVFFRDGSAGGISYATRHPDGFSEDQQALLRAVEDAVAITLDLNRTWILLRETLGMYVGAEPRDRILSGQVRSGDILPIRSAILFADMRGFTALASEKSGAETVELLNGYFDCVVPPVEAADGEVLKYIGDGVLAIFRSEDEEAAACERALGAAREIASRIASEPYGIKMALHFGEVAYGNIGSGARLDYTVVGGGVNLASRLADLAGQLERPILVSSAFAGRLSKLSFEPLGEHALKGVAQPQPAFAPGV